MNTASTVTMTEICNDIFLLLLLMSLSHLSVFVSALEETVLMNEQFLKRQSKKVRQIQCKFQRWRTSAVFDRANGLSADSQHIDQIALTNLLFFSDLR